MVAAGLTACIIITLIDQNRIATDGTLRIATDGTARIITP